MTAWAHYRDDPSYCAIARYEDARVVISTCWLGVHSVYLPGQPIIFATTLFVEPAADIPEGFDGRQWGWRTEEEAREGHDTLAKCYR